MHPGELARFDPISQSLTGINFSQLAIGVLGVLFITGEYGTGMIRSSMAATPKRLPVLWAKAILFAAVTLVLMEISAFLAFFAGQAALGSHSTSMGRSGSVASNGRHRPVPDRSGAAGRFSRFHHPLDRRRHRRPVRNTAGAARKHGRATSGRTCPATPAPPSTTCTPNRHPWLLGPASSSSASTPR